MPYALCLLKLPHPMEVVIHHDPDRRRKIQASYLAPDGYPVAWVLIANLCREAEGFASKEQIVSMVHICLCVIFLSVSAKSGKTRRTLYFPAFQKGLKVVMMSDVHLTPVIQPCPFEVFVIHPEPEWVNQVQPDLRRSAQSRDVSRVGRDLRLMEDHMEGWVFDDTVFDTDIILDHFQNKRDRSRFINRTAE